MSIVEKMITSSIERNVAASHTMRMIEARMELSKACSIISMEICLNEGDVTVEDLTWIKMQKKLLNSFMAKVIERYDEKEAAA